ncbi:hypothetical protein CSQ93_14280 [Janthinobacterium sp. BJB426]|nr:hypothetical protein CSQ93_14280 [Janthinobacterium sp. BJB426]
MTSLKFGYDLKLKKIGKKTARQFVPILHCTGFKLIEKFFVCKFGLCKRLIKTQENFMLRRIFKKIKIAGWAKAVGFPN